MCRMFGMATSEPVAPRDYLCDAPRSLRALSHEHADGWGIALHDGAAWTIERGVDRAADATRFGELARQPAQLAIAHVRKRTVGPTRLANTHPFRRDGLVFAHNGTVRD